MSMTRIAFQNESGNGDCIDLALPDDGPLARLLCRYVPGSPRTVVAPGLVAPVFYLSILQGDTNHLMVPAIPPSTQPDHCAAAMATAIKEIAQQLQPPEQDLRAEPGGQGDFLHYHKRTGGGRPGGTHGRR